jgi:ubiquinone/menaquinone biosynthesis C-methylase UbiE
VARASMLDIGTGAGYIAQYFAARAPSLLSVDVVDERVARGFDFRLVANELLPSADASHDVVISNHVIEHVDDQERHLREIARVLKPGGIAYLATPNRFALIEPHFKLPFLSWIPAVMRHPYVRLTRRAPRYDVSPLTFAMLHNLAAKAGLSVTDYSLLIAREELAARLPFAPRLPEVVRQVLPSFIVVLRRN